MVPSTAANASRSLDNYKLAAAAAPSNLPGGILPGQVGGNNGQGGIPLTPTDGTNGQIPGVPGAAASQMAPAALAFLGVVAAFFM